MTISKARTANGQIDDELIRAAVGFGVGLTIEETAEFAGKSVSTVKRYKEEPLAKRVIGHIEAALALRRSKSIEKVVADASERAEDKIRRVFNKSFAITESLVARAEAMGDLVSLEDAMEIHKSITTWAAKFVASEAPKRMEIDSTSTKTVLHIVGLAEAKNILATAKEIDSFTPKGLITEAEVVHDAPGDA